MTRTIRTKPTIRTACLLFSSLSLAALFACVTVNVTFPEAAVQQATDDYVQGLYKEKEKGKAQPSPKPEAEKRAPSSHLGLLQLIPEARAAESATGDLKITVNSPKAMKIRDQQIARLDKIHEAESAGSLGETNLGFLTLDHEGKVTPETRARLKPLVDAENADRKELYNEVLASNGYAPSRLIDLQKSFARSFQSHAAPGAWLQDDGGKWTRKR